MTILFLLFLASMAILLVIGYNQTKQSNSQLRHQQTQQESDAELISDANRMMLLIEVKRQAEARGDTETAQSVLNMTYDGPLPVEKPDGTFALLKSDILSYNIAGINYRENVGNYVGDFMGYIKPEPENPHDSNAIAIYHNDGCHLGYIRAECTDEVRGLLIPFPIPIWGTIEGHFDDDENRQYYHGTIHIEIKSKETPSKSQL